MSSQFNLQGFEEFKTPELPQSFEKGLELLQNFGASAVQQTQDLIGSAGNSIKSVVPGALAENDSNGPAVDFRSISNDNDNEYSGDIVFGGLLPLQGFYTTDYKSSCSPGQYDNEIQEQLGDIKEKQQLMEYLFSKTGALLNFHPGQNGIFIRKNLSANCSPTLARTKPKSRKIGEKCNRDNECITTSTENKPLCKKTIRDKYLTGICSEIIRGEGKKCKATKDCKNNNLECVNKKCTRKVNRLAVQASSSSNSTNKVPRVSTDIPIQGFKGLGLPQINKSLEKYYSAKPYGGYGSYGSGYGGYTY
jgi:hypothetical protein